MDSYVSAQVKTDHNLHTLRLILGDLTGGYFGDAHEHRCIADHKHDLESIAGMLRLLLDNINNADTAKTCQYDIAAMRCACGYSDLFGRSMGLVCKEGK